MLDIKINEFEGPLDLLLHLIENKKMNILDINISNVIDDYLEIINNYENDKFKLKVEFLQMASTLLEIKAFSILRSDKKNDKEEDLEKRLIEYKLFRELAEQFSKNENEYYISYKKKGLNDYTEEIIEHDNSELNLQTVQNILNSIYDKFNISNKNKIKINLEEKFSVEDAMSEIEKLNSNDKISFGSLLKGKYSRERIVSFFMAILELYKINKLEILIGDEDFYIIK